MIKNFDLKSILIIILLGLPSYFFLLQPGYFPMHDNIQIMRLFEMDQCFQYGQIPCRWVPDMGAGYGHPLFNYHPVFPYYLGQLFIMLNLSLINTTKVLLFLSLILSGIFMYYLTKEFFGRLSGIVAAIFFIYAPYHAVDLYVRGALTESWGITFFPLILFSLYKFIEEEKFVYFLLSIVSLTGLFLSHNIMTLLFTPIALLWVLLWLIYLKKNLKFIVNVALIFIFSVGLSAFFVLPSFFELSYINVLQNSGYYNFHEHFVTLRQLFIDTTFEYGGSTLYDNDHMSFQIGYHYWLIWLSFIGIIPYLYKKKRYKELAVIVFVWIITGIAVFMTHAKSVYIWKAISIFTFVQFPWRFLGIVIFSSSLLVGAVVSLVSPKSKILISVLLIISVIYLNFGFFKPEYLIKDATDAKMLSGDKWKEQSLATRGDYLPINVKISPKDLASNYPVSSDQLTLSELKRTSHIWEFQVSNPNLTQSLVTVPVFEFPIWEVKLNDQKVSYMVNKETGLIELNIPQGSYTVTGKLVNTGLRTLANTISLTTFLLLVVLVLIRYTNLYSFFKAKGFLWKN